MYDNYDYRLRISACQTGGEKFMYYLIQVHLVYEREIAMKKLP